MFEWVIEYATYSLIFLYFFLELRRDCLPDQSSKKKNKTKQNKKIIVQCIYNLNSNRPNSLINHTFLRLPVSISPYNYDILKPKFWYFSLFPFSSCRVENLLWKYDLNEVSWVKRLIWNIFSSWVQLTMSWRGEMTLLFLKWEIITDSL